MKKLLSILGSIGMLGSAGATVVACGETSPETPPTDNKTQLRTKIAEAQKLVENSTKSSTVTATLQAAITTAQVIVDKEAAIQDEITKAEAELKTAIENFNKAPNSGELETTIKEAEELLANNANKEKEVKDTFESAIGAAQNVFDTSTDQEEINNAVSVLKDAIEVFKASPDLVDKTKLIEKIAEAKQVLDEGEEKSEDVKLALQDAITKAERVLNDKDVKQPDVENAVTKLDSAIKAFKGESETETFAFLVNRKEMAATIKKAQELVKNSKKAYDVTGALKMFADYAQEALANKNSTENQLAKAFYELQSAIFYFNQAPDVE